MKEQVTSEEVKALRERFGLSREDLASRLGISHMTVYRWETGKSRIPSLGAQAFLRLREKLESDVAEGKSQ